MEYGIKDVESEDYQVALCLWANIHRALRRQGMAMMGFIFTLPPAMVAEDCAIRILYSRIHHGRPEEICYPMSADDMSEIDMKSELTPSLGDVQDPPEETVTEISRERQESEETLEELSPQSEILTGKDEHGNMDPPEESEIKILEADEYFLVGGTYHFEIFAVPKLTTWRSGLTYIHREKPKLRRIHFKMKFSPSEETPSRTQLTDRFEDEIQRQEIPAIIQLQLQLPKYVTFLEEPIPAYFYSDLNAFSASNIYEPVYNKDNHQISFRTNKFGMFAMLQKRYSNFPYKKWQIIGGDTVILSLSGNFIKIRIEISSSGCRIESINPDEDNIAHYIGAEWAPPEQLIQKLLSVGINISAEKKISEVLGFLPKISKLENEIYITMSLLCKKCDFFWCKWNRQLPRNQVVLKFLFKDEVKEFCSNLYHLILQDSSELQKQEPFHVDCGLIENVRSLLLRCRPLSCSQ
ncbi:protein CASC1-like isoform X2 [Stegodyphus dumicola]|uniref:protein CASC1-like isoform X2 n=1 Tax=Stegodyphus dumicola TaxID=202533 RepID=UPI0015B2492C|nr:protein CASC1-like isoform X2 [Stegodyphus dumicola]